MWNGMKLFSGATTFSVATFITLTEMSSSRGAGKCASNKKSLVWKEQINQVRPQRVSLDDERDLEERVSAKLAEIRAKTEEEKQEEEEGISVDEEETSTLMTESTEEESSEKTENDMKYIAVFLTKESKEKLDALRSKTDCTVKTGELDAPHMTVAFAPDTRTKEVLEPLFGHHVRMSILAVAEDNSVATAVVDPKSIPEQLGQTSSQGADVPFFPHVTLARSPQSEAVYSNVLLDRMSRLEGIASVLEDAQRVFDNVMTKDSRSVETKKQVVGENENEKKAVAGTGKDTTEKKKLNLNWSGTLPAFGTYPPSKASVQGIDAPVAGAVEGILCSVERWDAENEQCKGAEVAKECPFCTYMKAGPCGDVFTAWETCVEKSKEEGTDFFDECSAETLALKECVDANPDYYGFLEEVEKENKDVEKETKDVDKK
eukprot:g3623.t1